MTLDILIPVAEKGGVENVINQTGEYLLLNGWTVRVVQLVWEGIDWTSPKIEFYPLLEGRKGHDIEEMANAYADFLKKNGVPNIILATAWPYASFIAKQAAFLCDSSIPVASWLHAPVSRYEAAGYGGGEALNFADIHFAISNAIKAEIKSLGCKGPIFRINNPINKDKLPNIIPRSLKEARKKLLFVGRLSEEKRPEVIIKAVANTSFELHLVGSGERSYEIGLKALVERLQINDRVFFHGWQDNPWQVLKEVDAFILASAYEGFPLSAIEALSCGVPVISTPLPGMIELISPGESGFLFQYDDENGLADILNAMDFGQLPEVDPNFCKKIVAPYSYNIALKDFSIKLMEFAKNPYVMSSSCGSDKILYNNDKISVIIPCYNVEKFLPQCLDSIINQTMPSDMYEIICINDASPDSLMDILEDYERRFPDRMMIINCSKNLGPGAARNIATYDYAQGNYIAYIDSDDFVNPTYLEELYNTAAVYNADFSMVGFYNFDDFGGRHELKPNQAFFDMTNKEEKKNFILLQGANNSVFSKLFKTSFITDNNLCFPEGLFMEDVFFHHISMMSAKRIVTSSEVLYAYRTNPESIMNKEEKKYIRQIDTYKTVKLAYEILSDNNMLSGYENEYMLIFYIKAFVCLIPDRNKGVLSIDHEREELLRDIKRNALEIFPNLFDNEYILSDSSKFNMDFLEYLRKL